MRHPSQLYEAFLEGIVLFVILWNIRKRSWAKENLLAIYLIGYALARIVAEFFREPDAEIGYLLGFFSLGQILSFAMLVSGILLIIYGQKIKKLV
jgi:phosphatidylglycerol:prolipoprotein diacylglycerol transferase